MKNNDNYKQNNPPIIDSATKNKNDDEQKIVEVDINPQDVNLDQKKEEPHNEGETSISGSAPYVTSDDDTLQNAHNVGTQLGDTDEGEGKRQEVDIARDINQAEEDLRTH